MAGQVSIGMRPGARVTLIGLADQLSVAGVARRAQVVSAAPGRLKVDDDRLQRLVRKSRTAGDDGGQPSDEVKFGLLIVSAIRDVQASAQVYDNNCFMGFVKEKSETRNCRSKRPKTRPLATTGGGAVKHAREEVERGGTVDWQGGRGLNKILFHGAGHRRASILRRRALRSLWIDTNDVKRSVMYRM